MLLHYSAVGCFFQNLMDSQKENPVWGYNRPKRVFDMNWNYVGTGIGLAGLGLAVLLAPLPPSWWPSMSKGLIQATFAAALVLFALGLLFVVLGTLPPVFKDRSLWPQTGMVLSGLLFVICIVWFFLQPNDVSLPGFGSYAYIRLYDTPELRRRFVYDFATPQGGGIQFFLSSSDQFNFTVTDVNKEKYPLEIPIGATGIPIDRFIYLFCEVGIAQTETILRVTVDDKTVGERSLPFHIDLGDTSKLSHGTIGADINGQNNAPFKIAEMGIFKTTLTSKQKSSLIKNFNDFMKGTNQGAIR